MATDKAKEALEKVKNKGSDGYVKVTETIADPEPETEEQRAYLSMGISERTKMEMERGAKLVAGKARQREENLARKRESALRTEVTEVDGTPVTTDPET
jgi:hypothetical protein